MVGGVVIAAEEEAVGGTDSVGWLEALVAAASLETVGMRRAQPAKQEYGKYDQRRAQPL